MRIPSGLDKEKKNKITASFPASPVKIHAFGLLAVILFFFSLAGSAFTATPARAEFGLQRFALGAQNENGTPDTQAGSHPYSLTTTFVMNLPTEANKWEGELKDVHLQLPPGFVGDPTATPRCTYQEFSASLEGGSGTCPIETVIGLSTTYFDDGVAAFGVFTADTDAVYNLVPPKGVAAEFGFIVSGKVPVLLETSVRTGTDYGLTTSVSNINQTLLIAASKVSIWGVPAAASHDPWRGSCASSGGNGEEEAIETAGYGLRPGEAEREGPLYPERGADFGLPESSCVAESHAPKLPLLTNPSSCGVPRTSTFEVDDWEAPGNFATGEHVSKMEASLPELSGCEHLDFKPAITVKPDGEAGSTPTGLNVGVEVPQEGETNPVGLTEADVKDTTVTLPAGVQLNPSAADGLQACTGDPADQPGTPGNEIGFTGFKELNPSTEPGVETPQYTPTLPGSVPALAAGETAPLEPGKNFCPDASKVATVRIKTPLLEGEVKGSIYLASPQNFTFAGAAEENPFKSLVALYLVAEEPISGFLVKLPAEVRLCESAGEALDGVSCQGAGQIVTTFENTPQAPFSALETEFYGTDRAPLATPALCGSYQTQASFTAWSGKVENPTAEFKITSGPEVQTASGPQKTACPGSSLPFAPSLASDTTVTNAGAFSPLDTTLSREDGQQAIQQVTLHYPAGLTGLLSGVALCGEAEANAGTCSSASEIGETIVSVGEGGDPFSVTGGKVYITGPYEGAPFGLSIVNPAKAGPFDLEEGRPVVVRAKIEINPTTAALTVTTNTAAQGHAIPTILDGIPLQIKHVDVNITRPGFTINPTNCAKTQVTGTVASAEGASSPVSIPFQVGECRSLAFAPKFAVSTQGKTSKANGASLTAKLSYPVAAQGTQANIAAVKVDLPKALPSRLKTLQKACTNAQFQLNPANCPSASFIGHAVVHTPLLPVPLEGPAIFVSHGGEAFPSLTMVLQGDNVTIDLVGATYISPAGITSTTFKTVPDQPFSSFELTLPEGPYSALAANGNLCTQKLVMPTEFKAQNGAEIHESTAISTTGCSNALSVVSSKVNKKTLTLSVYAPAAGKVTASGKGVSNGVKTYSTHEALTFTLKQNKAGKLKTKVKLTYAPSKGKKQSKTITVSFKK